MHIRTTRISCSQFKRTTVAVKKKPHITHIIIYTCILIIIVFIGNQTCVRLYYNNNNTRITFVPQKELMIKRLHCTLNALTIISNWKVLNRFRFHESFKRFINNYFYIKYNNFIIHATFEHFKVFNFTNYYYQFYSAIRVIYAIFYEFRNIFVIFISPPCFYYFYLYVYYLLQYFRLLLI